METITTEVLVVGAGPAGLTASALLARAGVPALTVTKYGTANSPRAHITNQRTVEVFRDLGIEEGWAVCSNGAVLVRLDPGHADGYVVEEMTTFDPEPVLRSLYRLRYSGHEVILFHVLDELEANFPLTGLVDFADVEGPERHLEVDA